MGPELEGRCGETSSVVNDSGAEFCTSEPTASDDEDEDSMNDAITTQIMKAATSVATMGKGRFHQGLTINMGTGSSANFVGHRPCGDGRPRLSRYWSQFKSKASNDARGAMIPHHPRVSVRV